MDYNNIINTIKNEKLNALEIAGPTLLFTKDYKFSIYDIFPNIDNINLYNLKDSYKFTKNSDNNKLYNNTYSDIKDIKKEYNIIINSHVIEHMANPINTLNEYKKVLSKNGYILSFIPNKSVFWDKTRETTSFEHLLNDFTSNKEEDDDTHVEENLSVEHPFKLMNEHPDRPNGTFEDLCNNNVNNRIMHHHCFDLDLVKKLHEHIGFETIQCFNPTYDNLQLIYFGKLK
jgi:SAM-dependent methyltransferase